MGRVYGCCAGCPCRAEIALEHLLGSGVVLLCQPDIFSRALVSIGLERDLPVNGGLLLVRLNERLLIGVLLLRGLLLRDHLHERLPCGYARHH